MVHCGDFDIGPNQDAVFDFDDTWRKESRAFVDGDVFAKLYAATVIAIKRGNDGNGLVNFLLKEFIKQIPIIQIRWLFAGDFEA